jgi:hypothetical protein
MGVALLASACSISREGRPVGEGQFAAGVSLGGPLFTNLGPPIPTPVLAPYGRYGLRHDLDLDFGLDLTPAAAQGLDVGAAYELLDQRGAIPTVMAGARLYGFVNALGFTGQQDPVTGQGYSLEPHLFEEVYGNVSWTLGQPWLVWTGVDLFAQAQHGVFAPSPLAGVEYRFTHLGLAAECKWLEVQHNQEFSTLAFVGPGHYGAIALQVGVNFYPAGAP